MGIREIDLFLYGRIQGVGHWESHGTNRMSLLPRWTLGKLSDTRYTLAFFYLLFFYWAE